MPNPLLSTGDIAPEFTLQSDEGVPFSLTDQRGKSLVIYFYPRDNTPGCTTEANEFNSLLEEFEAAGVQVVGISPDGLESHRKFRTGQHLRFPLLSDDGREVARRFGVFRTKKMYGREVEGIVRSTFLIDAEGRIAELWDNVRAKGHAARVLERVKKGV
ncbi:MAG: peroxiredoxin [Deltaproteobacteria bacterium]|nr:MAG: peroxiredoxin [Deltaproteobacteria bacterium]